jgi:alpha-glucosidase
VQALTSKESEAPFGLRSADWWRSAVGYEVYVRSFADSDGDGVGDLRGITRRLGYLAELGVDVVWMTPFFPSPGLDHGYDVSDYTDIDPALGTLGDWAEMAGEAERLGLRLFVDIVPNHTSSHHRWFQQAVADPSGPYRDYYLWADPAPGGGPPNNWVSHFGGPAWSLDPGGSGQYYCHLFLPEQPDLNWANPAVMDEFGHILNFWLDRGAHGFRIDVAHGLTKEPGFPDNPQHRPISAGMHPTQVFESFHHVHDLHRADTARLFHRWREAIAHRPDAVLLGEMDTRDVERFTTFVGDGRGLHAGFVLQLGLTGWDPEHIVATIVDYQRRANGGCAWEVSNHDQSRAVSRYGGGEAGLRRTLAVSTLLASLDGILFLYQGEELGLPDARLAGAPADPMSARNAEGTWGRDVARGPMPWTVDGPTNGFSSGPAWLATAPLSPTLTVEAQQHEADSTWQRYHQLVTLRKRFHQLWSEPLRFDSIDGPTVSIARGSLRVLANLGGDVKAVAAMPGDEVLFESTSGACTPAEDTWLVAAESTVVLSRREP